MASPSPSSAKMNPSLSPGPARDEADPEDDAGPNADVPLTMAASVVLSALPRSASKALEGAGELGVTKGEVLSLLRCRESTLPFLSPTCRAVPAPLLEKRAAVLLCKRSIHILSYCNAPNRSGSCHCSSGTGTKCS